MKCDLEWLAEWLGEVPPAAELARLFTMAGLEVVERDGPVLGLDLTPNRGDCLSVRGLAREASALTGAEFKAFPEPRPAIAAAMPAPGLGAIEPEACPYYGLRLIEGLDPTAATPRWMRERLERCGVRAHDLLVDVTNYVMLELGQPLHAFDADAVAGAVSVRWAREGETLRALDETRLALAPDMLVIAAGDRPLALAGIVGGAASAVSETTTRVLLESAHFAPAAIAGRARRLKLRTESSRRFERGVDPCLPPLALRRATALILEHAGGRASDAAAAGEPAAVHLGEKITLRARRLAQCLALEVEAAEVARILSALGCGVEEHAGRWEVSAPSWRFDLALEEDLIEEVARVHGYDRIEAAAMPRRSGWDVPSQAWARQLERCRARLVASGYSEAVTYSFAEERLERVFAPDAEPWRLLNPISPQQAVMRLTLLPSLLRAAQYNLNRQRADVRLFETARTYARDGAGGARESWMLGGVACGAARPPQWGEAARPIDFYDVKGDLESLLQGGCGALEFAPAQRPGLHPGQTAGVSLDGREIGILGAVHPRLSDEFDLAGPAFVFELRLEALGESPHPGVAAWSEYPAVARDLNVVVAEATSAAAVEACVRALGLEQLEAVAVFDVYRGEGLEAGRKSLGLRLIFQSFSSTLTDLEVAGRLERVVSELSKLLGAETRQWRKP